MIKRIDEEFREGDLGVRTSIITLFGIPIFKFRTTTTNHNVVAMLTVKPVYNKIKGFNNETENQSKKTKRNKTAKGNK